MRDVTLKELLLRHELVSAQHLAEAEWATQAGRHSWLEELLLRGRLDEERYVDCVGRALYVPRCDLERLANVPADVLALIPGDLAAEHRILPLWVEADGDLRVVMADPTDRRAFDEAQFFADRRLLREVAAPSAVAWALDRYHGVSSVLWPHAIQADPAYASYELAA